MIYYLKKIMHISTQKIIFLIYFYISIFFLNKFLYIHTKDVKERRPRPLEHIKDPKKGTMTP